VTCGGLLASADASSPIFDTVFDNQGRHHLGCWNRPAVNALAAHKACVEALEMVRDADDDCKRDGLQTIPPFARAKIDAALEALEKANAGEKG
jgi:hypothetical protein